MEGPKVIWVGIEPEDEVNSLQRDVDGELLNLFAEPQRFSSHITLGRIKVVRNREQFLKKVESVQVEPMEFELSWLKLYKSVRKGSTHVYVCIKEF